MNSIEHAIGESVALHVKSLLKEFLQAHYNGAADSGKKKPLLTTAEVCEILKCNRHHIYDLIETKQLPTAKIGKVHRFRIEDVQNYIKTMFNDIKD